MDLWYSVLNIHDQSVCRQGHNTLCHFMEGVHISRFLLRQVHQRSGGHGQQNMLNPTVQRVRSFFHSLFQLCQRTVHIANDCQDRKCNDIVIYLLISKHIDKMLWFHFDHILQHKRVELMHLNCIIVIILVVALDNPCKKKNIFWITEVLYKMGSTLRETLDKQRISVSSVQALN